MGVEALSRGVDEGGALIPPAALFRRAAEQGLTHELDRLCRDKAVERFLPLQRANPDLILFVNLDIGTWQQEVGAPDGLAPLVRRHGLDPRNVAIEVLEAAFDAPVRLRESVRRHKERGFLVALDDVGAGHSNLDRIPDIQPDIIKADMSLVRGIGKSYPKQEVFKALVQLAERVGGWLVTEGVETPEEAVVTLGMGADMLQGFYFARPRRADDPAVLQPEPGRHADTAARFKRHTLDSLRAAQSQRTSRHALAGTVARALDGAAREGLGEALAQSVRAHPTIESACVLDQDGVQVTETVLNADTAPRFHLEKTVIFHPPARGTSHALKEYFYVLREAGQDPYETAPYVPLPSGTLCVTISTAFSDAAGQPLVLCLHTRLGQAP